MLTADLRGAIGFSSFGVLLYYAVANAAALHPGAGASPLAARPCRCSALLGCLVLVATLPLTSVVAGVAVFAVGVVGRALVRRVRGSR